MLKNKIPTLGFILPGTPIWSIGIFDVINNNNSLHLIPNKNNPVLKAEDIKDMKARYVADPFILFEQDTYFMFFEIYGTKMGCIGLATSKNGYEWEYKKIVINERFHLSYPQIIKYRDEVYMVPESSADNSVRLYKANSFPSEWQLNKILLQGHDFTDPTIFYYNSKWWMLVTTNKDSELRLYYSNSLIENWREHPQSPIGKDNMQNLRSAGSVIFLNNRLVRLTQDCSDSYGKSIKTFEITNIDEKIYEEIERNHLISLNTMQEKWNRDGIHHLSLCKQNNEKCIACIDGKISSTSSFILLGSHKIKLPNKVGTLLKFIQSLISSS